MRSKNSRQHTADESAWLADVKRCPCVFCGKAAPSEAHHVKQGCHRATIAACKFCHDNRVWNFGVSEIEGIDRTIASVMAIREGREPQKFVDLRNRQRSTRTPSKIIPRLVA